MMSGSCVLLFFSHCMFEEAKRKLRRKEIKTGMVSGGAFSICYKTDSSQTSIMYHITSLIW